MSAILEKIRKLLALSKSDNANEAAVAAAAAQRLMTEHQIAEAELQGDGEPQETACVGEPIDTFDGAAPGWKGSLVAGLSRLHGCKVWQDTGFRNGDKFSRYSIVGRPSDVASVRYLYAWLVSEIERLAQKNAMGHGRRYANSYRMGAVNGVIAAMGEATREARSKATGEALVRIDARAVEVARVMADLDLNLRNRSSGARYSKDGYERGQSAGRGLHSGAKLGASSGARLLGTG